MITKALAKPLLSVEYKKGNGDQGRTLGSENVFPGNLTSIAAMPVIKHVLFKVTTNITELAERYSRYTLRSILEPQKGSNLRSKTPNKEDLCCERLSITLYQKAAKTEDLGLIFETIDPRDW